MQLEEIGYQYLTQAERLLNHIHSLNKTINSLSGNNKILMKRRIVSLYSDAAECRRYANILINYRKGAKRNEQNNI